MAPQWVNIVLLSLKCLVPRLGLDPNLTQLHQGILPPAGQAPPVEEMCRRIARHVNLAWWYSGLTGLYWPQVTILLGESPMHRLRTLGLHCDQVKVVSPLHPVHRQISAWLRLGSQEIPSCMLGMSATARPAP